MQVVAALLAFPLIRHLFHYDDPEVADRLMKVLEFDPATPVREAMDPWARAFRGGVLGMVVVDEDMPEPVREIARRVAERYYASREALGFPVLQDPRDQEEPHE